MGHKKLTEAERVLLGQWLKVGIAKKEIARRLGRDIKTIRRELNRNKTRVAVGKDREIIYEPIHAHAVAMERKQHAWMSKQPLTNKNIYRYVLEHLRSGWSPERLHRITANEVVLAAKKIFTPLPVHARRSTTLDNGSEHTDHKEFGIQAYFADPYASWQRGGQ